MPLKRLGKKSLEQILLYKVMKTKAEKKQERKQRLESFRSDILPTISKMYKVSSHGPNNAPDTMYKIIIHSELVYDYYPMSEKLRRNRSGVCEWGSYTSNDILDGIKRLKK